MLVKNKNNFLLKFFTGLALTLIPFFGAQAFSVRPLLVEFRTSPGQVTGHAVRITNDEKNTICLTLETENISAMSSNGAPIFEEKKSIGLAQWISLAEKNICLWPKETREVHLIAAIPDGVLKSGYYAAAFFTPVSAEQKETGAAIVNRVGLLIAARIDNAVLVERGMISKFTYDQATKNFTLNFKNEGNVHLRPYGSIALKNKKGETMETLPVNENGLLVLPESTRNFVVLLQKPMFGKIEASINLFYGTGPKSAIATITIPFPEIENKNSYWAIGLPLLVGLIFVARSARKVSKKFGTYV